MMQSRKNQIQHIIRLKRLDAFLVTNMKNIRYLTGFSGSSGFAIITHEKGIFFTDFRYKEQSEKEVKDFEIKVEKGKRIKLIKDFVKKEGIKKLGFEKTISYEFYELLKKIPVELLPQRHIVEEMRKIKDEEEIENIKKAIKRAEDAFLKIKPKIRVGIKEREIALRLEEQLKKVGCRNIPFNIIVASGKNSSMPHARPTERKIEKGDFVIIDWGGEYNGYYSDITRTFLMDCWNCNKKIEIYNAVNYARQKAIKSIKEGLKTDEIDSIVRNAIKKAGYGEFFGHGTGHGIGLDVHEYPHVSWNKSEKILNNMIFTIEPGIYIQEFGGVRIEDMVLVRNGQAELLTSLSRDLEIIR